MSSLSVCIITYNEELNIEEALRSVAFADEIIVVDSYSSDQTVNICKKYTNKIYLNPWEGCGIQKKLAVDKATSEWVLILDADERLSIELQQEIQKIIKNHHEDHSYAGFFIPFITFYLGKALKYGNCYHEKHLRLFRREHGTIIPNYVHFGLEVPGKIGNLNGLIYHYSFPNLEKVLKKMDLYSSLGAKDKLKAGKTNTGVFIALLHGLFSFIKGYFFKLGFLDGKHGFIFAVSNAEGSYYKYIKLMFLLNK